MERIEYSSDQMTLVREKVIQLIKIVAELEAAFPGRQFTLDGHLVGSMGEVLAAYYYGVELYKASEPKHDGEVDGRKVQIKITQQDNIVICDEPDYLIALYLTKKGKVYEVYNGPGAKPWETASKPDSHNNRHMSVNKLMSMDADVLPENRIEPKQHIEKMRTEYKNKKK